MNNSEYNFDNNNNNNNQYYGEKNNNEIDNSLVKQESKQSEIVLNNNNNNNNIEKIKSDDNAVIKISNLCVDYNQTIILSNVNFSIFKGHMHAFIGPNGAGKTTTIKSILGAIPIVSGTIKFEKKKKGKYWDYPSFGYVPEVVKYNTLLTVEKALNIRKIFKDVLNEDFEKKMDYFNKNISDISSLMSRKISELSSGQQKMIMLFDATMTDTDLLILDEPLENLDPTTRIKFFDYLKKYVFEEGKTVFISSHVLNELDEFADYVTFIKNGQILFSNKKSELGKNNYDIEIKSYYIDKIKELFKNERIVYENQDTIVISFSRNISIEECSQLLVERRIIFYSIKKQKDSLLNVYKDFFIHNNERETNNE